MKAKIAVLGIGNPIMTDEGIGVVLVQRLEAQTERYPDVDFLEVGTGGMKLLHILEGYQKAILIDCAYMDQVSGTMRRFTLEEVQSMKKRPDLSLHEGDLLQFLRMAQQLDMCPPEVIIFGIQPDRLEPGHDLTETLKTRLESFQREILSELETTANVP